jgi:hypothetical protein
MVVATNVFKDKKKTRKPRERERERETVVDGVLTPT